MTEHRFEFDTLQAFADTLLREAGARAEDAACVAHHLVDANLKGHDSHGVGLLPAYLRHMREDLVNLGSTDRLLQETSVLLQMDADGGWGAPSGFRLIDRAIDKARAEGLAAATIGNVHHLGRIGAYAEKASAAGIASLHFVNVTDHGPLVAPYRGSDARFGTNPVCIGFPAAGKRAPFLLDIATSQIALGKVRVAAARGTQVPTGSLIDEKGLPTTDPSGMAGFELKGALTPMAGHKGYGLAFACEILAGVLSGCGTIQPANPRRGGIQNRMFSILINPDKFGDRAWMDAEIEAMADYALASPLMDWDSPVLYPGDPERAIAGKRRREGIPLHENTVKDLNKAADACNSAARL
ncbi:MAG: malate/lactate/ureidoglycolate dehydrogenase [Maricaulis sp.]|nr:malate/lactate/ureidoglycolate dehydrogenase [Maricaulis sp.]